MKNTFEPKKEINEVEKQLKKEIFIAEIKNKAIKSDKEIKNKNGKRI